MSLSFSYWMSMMSNHWFYGTSVNPLMLATTISPPTSPTMSSTVTIILSLLINIDYVTPRFPVRPEFEARDHILGLFTCFFFFKTLVGPSLIIESKYHIQNYKIKLPPWWCLQCHIHTVLSLIYIYKTIHYIYMIRARNLQ